MTTRTRWPDLPAETRAAVEARTGRVTRFRDIPHGFTCATAAVLGTDDGELFVKGVPVRDRDGRAAQSREVCTARLVPATVGPRYRWRLTAGGWDLLAFAYIPDGRHADLSPGSPDVPLLVKTLACAAVRPPGGGTLPSFAERWREWADPGQLDLLRGDWLAHTDLNPHNLLISGGRAWLVDWAMPALGPAWLDAGHFAVRLIEEGHEPDEALRWAARIPGWATATPAAVGVWADAHCRRWVATLRPALAAPNLRVFAGFMAAVTRRATPGATWVGADGFEPPTSAL